jgi:hypothetical protein
MKHGVEEGIVVVNQNCSEHVWVWGWSFGIVLVQHLVAGLVSSRLLPLGAGPPRQLRFWEGVVVSCGIEYCFVIVVVGVFDCLIVVSVVCFGLVLSLEFGQRWQLVLRVKKKKEGVWMGWRV